MGSKWHPKAGDPVQLKDPDFPKEFGSFAKVVANRGLGLVKVVTDDTKREFNTNKRHLHRLDIYPPMVTQ